MMEMFGLTPEKLAEYENLFRQTVDLLNEMSRSIEKSHRELVEIKELLQNAAVA